MELLDTLTGERRDLLEGRVDPNGPVRMYICGVTPYSESHVGHALHAIVFDVLRRYLDWRGIPITHVQNFTDIDDKLIERANRLGVPMLERGCGRGGWGVRGLGCRGHGVTGS